MRKKFEDFTEQDLQALRNEIVLNSIYVADYRNSFGIDEHSVCEFFDSFMSFINELSIEDGNKDLPWDEFMEQYDTIDNLVEWFYCYEDFSWVQYEPEEDEEEIDLAA